MDIQLLTSYLRRIQDAADIFWQICQDAWSQPHTPLLLGIALALALLVVVSRKIRKRFRPIKLFNNKVGEVEVSRKALNELVQSVCFSLGALNRPDVEIFQRRGKLCMTVSLKLESGQKLTEATGEIQTALTTAFREHLGVEKLGKIDVKVLGFKGLIYKPANKFLPPVEDVKSEIIDGKTPVIDVVDSAAK